jgi:hypothetical protein
MQRHKGDQPTWTRYKPIFQIEYARITNNKLIVNALANLVMKPGEPNKELSTGSPKLRSSSKRVIATTRKRAQSVLMT